jgi:hypothetical protein
VASNVFMTFAWYGHLKNLATAPWYIGGARQLGHCPVRIPVAGAGQPHRLPAGRLHARPAQDHAGSDHAGGVRALCAVLHGEPFKLDYLWAALCMVGAVYFIFRSG